MNIRKNGQAAVLLVLLIVAGGPVGKGFGMAASQAQPAEQTAQLRELAERLLAPPHPGPDGQKQTVQLLPGQLPSGLSLDPPVLPSGRIIGSAIYGFGGKEQRTTIVLDVPGNTSDVLAFYERELSARGWKTAPHGPGRPSGFQPTQMSLHQFFCQGQDGPWLSLSVFSMTTVLNDVRLDLNTVDPGPCAPVSVIAAEPPFGPPTGADLIPPLYAPEGAQLQPIGGGAGPGRWTSEAFVETDQKVAKLETHFTQQLQAAGWTRLTGRADGPLAWSTWKVPGESDWQGFLFVLEVAGANRRALHVEVNSATAQFGPHGHGRFLPFFGGSYGYGARGVSPAVRRAH